MTAHKEYGFELYNEPPADSYEYVYRGHFNEGITNHILKLTETKLAKKHATRNLRKRISFVIIENLQNISRHQDIPETAEKVENCLFVLQITPKAARIFTGNYIETKKQNALEKKLKKIKSMNSDEMKQLYQEILTDTKISKKGGAGLGLISLGRRTDGHIRYRFVPVNEKMSFFYIQNQLLITEQPDKEEEAAFFERMIAYHKLLEKENVLLNFKGAFAFDNVEVLLPVINSQRIGGFGRKRLIYNISVNLIRNIVLYAENKRENGGAFFPVTENEKDSLGIYVLSRKDGKVKITSGNYIANDKVLTLKNKIDLINRTGRDGLLKIRDYLNNFYPEEHVGRPDISLIDMKLINDGRDIGYNFDTVDTERSFFTIQIEI